MKNKLQLNLFADLASCVILLMVYSILNGFGKGLYIAELTFGNILLRKSFLIPSLDYYITRKDDNSKLKQATSP